MRVGGSIQRLSSPVVMWYFLGGKTLLGTNNEMLTVVGSGCWEGDYYIIFYNFMYVLNLPQKLYNRGS